MAAVLSGVEGLRVIEADAEADGSLTVWVVTDHPAAPACPDCGTRSARVHEQVLARPRDVRRGVDEVRVAWLKRRWKCGNQECGRKTFTGSLPGVPARCRLTERPRGLAGAEVAGRGCTVAGAARWQRTSWPVAHQAFARQADPVLGQPPSLVAHLGIDEHRRGRPRWRIDAETSEYVLLADRWHTCFSGLSGDQGLLGQAAAATVTPRTGWRRRPRRGATTSRSSRPACAASTPRRYGGCCRARSSSWTYSMSCSWP
jgi:transposase